jgi:hypothetical protein
MASIWEQLVVLCGGIKYVLWFLFQIECCGFEHNPSTRQPPKVLFYRNGPAVGPHKHALVALFFWEEVVEHSLSLCQSVLVHLIIFLTLSLISTNIYHCPYVYYLC